jgi:hypothetical protein
MALNEFASSREMEVRRKVYSSKGIRGNSRTDPRPVLLPKLPSTVKISQKEDGKVYFTMYLQNQSADSPHTGISQHASQLVSRSNYQHIVGGNYSQLGLSYPNNLTMTLNSKRSNHNAAEQGQRNRIKTALQELAQTVTATPPRLW